MNWLSTGLRALLRVEWRRHRQHPWRSLLIAALIAVPVAAIVGGSALVRMTRPTLPELQAQATGRAALAVVSTRTPRSADAVAREPQLPAGTEQCRLWLSRSSVTVAGLQVSVLLTRAAADAIGRRDDPDAGLATGRMVLESGRAPESPNEVAVSPDVLDVLGVEVGGVVRVGDEEGERTVCGIVVDPEDLDRSVAWILGTGEGLASNVQPVWLLQPADGDGSDATGALAESLRADGFHVTERALVQVGDGFEDWAIFIVGGIGLLEAALVIAAAFSVSLRRRQREIGLLGSTGAAERGIQAAMLWSAAGLAVIGSIVGVAVGAGVAAALHPFLDDWLGRRNGGFELPPVQVGLAVLLGIVTAILAAWLPTRSATRMPIRVALSGRRPVATPSRRWLWVGLALIVGGVAMIALGGTSRSAVAGIGLLFGSILAVAGFGACSPWLLDTLAGWAAPLSLPWRLAVRDAGRFRLRDGPVVTAVLAGMSISVTVAALLASLQGAQSGRRVRLAEDWLVVEGPAAATVAQRVQDSMDAVAAAPWRAVYGPGGLLWVFWRDADGRPQRGWIAVGGSDLLAAHHRPRGIEELAAGHLLALQSSYQPGSLTAVGRNEGAVELPPVAVPKDGVRRVGPAFVLSAAAVAEHGLQVGPSPGPGVGAWLVRLRDPVSAEHLERARSVAAGVRRTTVDAARLHEAPARIFYRVVLLICFLTGLVVVAVATALSAIESAADRRVLATVGAPPDLIRRQLAARTGYLALVGCALAIPAGMVPAVGLIAIARVPLPLVVPWTEVLITLLGLPAVAYFGAWVVATLRPSIRRHSLSMEAF